MPKRGKANVTKEGIFWVPTQVRHWNLVFPHMPLISSSKFPTKAISISPLLDSLLVLLLLRPHFFVLFLPSDHLPSDFLPELFSCAHHIGSQAHSPQAMRILAAVPFFRRHPHLADPSAEALPSNGPTTLPIFPSAADEKPPCPADVPSPSRSHLVLTRAV